MQKDDDTSKNDAPEDDIAGAITSDEQKERKPGELGRSNRVGGDLAGVIRHEDAGPGEVALDRTATKPTTDQPLWRGSDINDQKLERNWRPETQSYIHADNAVTGIELAADITFSEKFLKECP